MDNMLMPTNTTAANSATDNRNAMPFAAVKCEVSEERIELMDNMWPTEHKCDRMACRQAAHQLTTMSQMIATLSQLNDYYLTQINCCQSDCQTVVSPQRQQLNELMAKNDQIISVNLARLKAEPTLLNSTNNNNIANKNNNGVKCALRQRPPKRYVPIDSDDEEFVTACRAKQPSIQVNQNNKTEKKICNFCGKRFWPSVLKLHISKQHPNEVIVENITEPQLSDNIESTTSCLHCGQQFSSQRDLDQHVHALHSQFNTDLTCNKFIDHHFGEVNESLRDEHIFDDNSMDYESEDFDEDFDPNEDNESVTSIEVNNAESNKTAKTEEISDKNVTVRRSKRKRNSTSDKVGDSETKCNVCGKVMSTPASLQIHMRRHTGVRPYVCDWSGCDASFTLRPQLESHIGKCHPIDKHLKCDFPNCDFETNSKYWLRRHRSRKHNLKMDAKTGGEVQKEVLVCSWPGCERKYPINSLLTEHYRTHTGERQYTCNWPGCERKFRYKYRLTVHMRVHTGERPMVCSWPGCEKTFRNNACLIAHRLTHDKTIKRRHVCEWPGCDKSFDSSQLHEQHIYAAHTKERPFKCDWPGCESTFSSRRNMERHHEYVHKLNLSERKFKCDRQDCDRSYVDSVSLDKHIARMHDIQKASYIKNKRTRKLEPRYRCDWPGCEYQALFPRALQIHRMRHTGERPIKCQWPNCHFSTVRKFQLDNHMLKHTGETPFPCEWPDCGRRFKSQRALDYHSEKTHQIASNNFDETVTEEPIAELSSDPQLQQL